MGILIENLHKKYSGNMVLNNINIKITSPGVYLIAGPNGSGKTTLLEILIGLRKQTYGKVEIMGAIPDSVEAKQNLGFLSQQNSLRKSCYVYEEMKMILELFGISNMDIKSYLEKYGLEKYVNYKTKKLSGGSKRRLLLAMTLLPRQNIIVLDEPVSGLDPFSRSEIWNMITEVSKDRIVIVSDHYLNQAAQYSDYIFLLDRGYIVLEGSFDKLSFHTNKTHVIKTRKKQHETIETILNELSLKYDLRISGTMYNYYIKTDVPLNIATLEKDFRVSSLDFEDIYFYHTGKYSHEGGDIIE